MFVVDASLWVSLSIEDDRFHRRTSAWFTDALADRRRLYSPRLVLPEVAGAVARRLRLPDAGIEAARRVATFPGVRVVAFGPALADASVELAARYFLRGPDAVYAALAQRLGVPLVTWDDQQRERASQVVTALAPEA